MTDTPTTSTLRDLLVQAFEEGTKIQNSDPARLWIQVPVDTFPGIESALLASLHAEISQLRGKVAAADRFREYADNFVLNATVSDPYLSEQWGYLTAKYDDTPSAGALAVNDAQHAVAENISAHIKATRSSGVYPTSENARELLAMVDTFYEMKSSAATPPAVARNYGHIDYYGPLCGPTTSTSDVTPPAVEDAERSCIECGGQGYWDDPGSASLRRTCWTCKGTGITPPAVADAGETGEVEPPTNRELDHAIMGACIAIETCEETLAALRRDVDALKESSAIRLGAHNTLVGRIDNLESRERPEPGSVVTDAMIDAFWSVWGVGTLDALTREPVRAALSAALAAKDGET